MVVTRVKSEQQVRLQTRNSGELVVVHHVVPGGGGGGGGVD